MPPRRSARGAAAAAAAPKLPLDGLVVALSGTFDGHSQADAKSKVTSLGATVSSSVTKATTHLITTEHDYLRDTTKVKAARSNDLPIVGFDWVLACESSGKREPEKAHDVAKSALAAQAAVQSQQQSRTAAKAKNGASRAASSAAVSAAASDAEDDEDSKPKPKLAGKRKAAGKRATSSAAATAAASDDEDEQADAKSQKRTTNGRGGTKRSATAAVSDDEQDVKPSAKRTKKGDNSKSNGSLNGGTKDAAVVSDDEAKPAPAAAEPKKEEKAEKEQVANGQIAKSKDIQVPLDEACLMNGYSVYIDDNGHIWDASLNQTNASNNNNKFYRVQVIRNGAGDFKTWTRWGRVGERGQTACLGNGSEADAIKHFEKKFKDKSGNAWEDRLNPPKPGKYTFVERSYNADSDDDGNEADGDDEADESKGDKWVPPACTLLNPVQELVKLIFNQQYFAAAMSELNYDANKLPLGKLSKATISRGFQALKDLAALLDNPDLALPTYGMTPANATEHLSNTYYSVIPHAFGRSRPPVICEHTLLKKEVELLESLSDMKDASIIMGKDKADRDPVHPLDKMYNGLHLDEMTPLDSGGDEFKLLKDYLNETRGYTHGHTYTVKDIFRIERHGEHERFDKQSPLAGPPRDRRLLWHGSRVTNFGGILSQGLRIAPPEAPVSGYMFGKGIYLADMSSKSANYCCSYISGGEALLLLCEAELGDPMQELTDADYEAGDKARKKGMFSTWGKGQTGPMKWRDAGAVHPSLQGVKMPDTTVKPGKTNVQGAYLQYNEYIVYDVSQVRLRYLFRVKM